MVYFCQLEARSRIAAASEVKSSGDAAEEIHPHPTSPTRGDSWLANAGPKSVVGTTSSFYLKLTQRSLAILCDIRFPPDLGLSLADAVAFRSKGPPAQCGSEIPRRSPGTPERRSVGLRLNYMFSTGFLRSEY